MTLNIILTFIRLICIISMASGKKDIVSFEIKIPGFLNSILGLDESLKSFRASLGSNKDNNDINDLAIALTAGNRTGSGGDEFHKRTVGEHDLMKVNIVGVNDAASVLQSLIQPYTGMAPQTMMDTIKSLLRRSFHENKPNVEMAPGSIKSEIVTYPPNFLEKRLKYLLKLKQKEEEADKPPEVVL